MSPAMTMAVVVRFLPVRQWNTMAGPSSSILRSSWPRTMFNSSSKFWWQQQWFNKTEQDCQPKQKKWQIDKEASELSPKDYSNMRNASLCHTMSILFLLLAFTQSVDSSFHSLFHCSVIPVIKDDSRKILQK